MKRPTHTHRSCTSKFKMSMHIHENTHSYPQNLHIRMGILYEKTACQSATHRQVHAHKASHSPGHIPTSACTKIMMARSPTTVQLTSSHSALSINQMQHYSIQSTAEPLSIACDFVSPQGLHSSCCEPACVWPASV